MVEDGDAPRLIRTVVKLCSENYDVYENKLYILKDCHEFVFRYIPSTYSGADRTMAPIFFREMEYFHFDYIGCEIYSKR